MLGGLGSNFAVSVDAVNAFKNKISTFVGYMTKLYTNSEIPYIILSTKMWVAVFLKFQARLVELESTRPLDMFDKTNIIIDEARSLMSFIADTFKDIHPQIYTLSLYMSHGLTRENTRPKVVGLMNIKDSVEYLSAIFEYMGRRMRELQCHDSKFYFFLGFESQPVIDSILTLLDPGHTAIVIDPTKDPNQD
jgi:hypothetical protein